MIARLAAHASWKRTGDRTARTANARSGLDRRFEREVDPDGSLTPAARAAAVANARKEYFTRLALRSAQARRRRAARGDDGGELA